MASESYPNATHNSGAVTTAEYEQMVAYGLGTGLVGTPADTAVVYADSSGRQVKIRSGKRAVVRGSAWYSGAADITIPISANASGSTRIDRIVLRLTKASGEITEEVVEGTPGAGAPALTRDLGTSGVFEFPLARVTVADGALTLAAGTVNLDGWYLAPNPVAGVTTTLPEASDQAAGMIVYDSQVDEAYISTGGTLRTLYADSGWVALSAAAGWRAITMQYRKTNGLMVLHLSATRTGGDLARNQDSTIATLPSGFRPVSPNETKVPGQAWTGTGTVHALVRIYTDGRIVLTDNSDTNLPTGTNLYLPPVPLHTT